MPASSTAAERQSSEPCDSIEVYTQRGCPHCGRALTFIDELQARYPAITVRHYDLTTNVEARERLIALSQARLQARRGRWLNLASTIVIIALGLMLSIAPQRLLLAI